MVGAHSHPVRSGTRRDGRQRPDRQGPDRDRQDRRLRHDCAQQDRSREADPFRNRYHSHQGARHAGGHRAQEDLPQIGTYQHRRLRGSTHRQADQRPQEGSGHHRRNPRKAEGHDREGGFGSLPGQRSGARRGRPYARHGIRGGFGLHYGAHPRDQAHPVVLGHRGQGRSGTGRGYAHRPRHGRHLRRHAHHRAHQAVHHPLQEEREEGIALRAPGEGNPQDHRLLRHQIHGRRNLSGTEGRGSEGGNLTRRHAPEAEGEGHRRLQGQPHTHITGHRRGRQGSRRQGRGPRH